MSLRVIDPIADRRWDELVTHHPRSSAFHQKGWLQALALTYGYTPMVLTSSADGEPLRDGLVLCRVSSWLTRTRMVSLPFADHCDPLFSDPSESFKFAEWLKTECHRQRWNYVELRPSTPLGGSDPTLSAGTSYYFHELDLSASLEQLFGNLHKDCIQRKIHRAERAQLSYEVGNSARLVDEFYRLLLITKRRHRLLPQPRSWFTNLVTCMGASLQIRMVRKNGHPVATMLTLQHRDSIIYKYGCSDERFHSLGSMPFMFWKLIEEGKASGASRLDFGRSDLDNQGLIIFKDRFGAHRRLLTYQRYRGIGREHSVRHWNFAAIRQVFSILPDVVSSTAGRVLYKHIG